MANLKARRKKRSVVMAFTPKYVSPTYAGEKILLVTKKDHEKQTQLFLRYDSHCKLHFIVKKLGRYTSQDGEYRYVPANALDVCVA
jgi:hypothetical protein